MRRDWLRIDLPTLALSVLGGLLPVVIISVVSFLYLSARSQPLLDFVMRQEVEALRGAVRQLGDDCDGRMASLRSHLSAAVLTRNGTGDAPAEGAAVDLPAPNDLDLVRSIHWYTGGSRPRWQGHVGAREESAEAILTGLAGVEDLATRRERLATLTTLSPAVQDPVGFSYGVESALYIGMTGSEFQELLLTHGAGLDATTFEVALERIGGMLQLPALPVPCSASGDAPPLQPGEARLAGAQGELLELGAEMAYGGVLVAELDAHRFLERALAAAEARSGGGELERFLLIPSAGSTPVGATEDALEPLRQVLEPPFDEGFELCLGDGGAEQSTLSATLAGLRGAHYLWWAGAVLLAGVVCSVLLGVVASRRVQLSQKKDDFLRLVSHQLRTPIASVRMLADTLSLGRVRGEEDRHELTTQLQKETERLAELVERVLEYGRSEGGRANAREVVTDPGDLIEEAVGIFRERHADAGEIVVRTAQEFHPVVLDREAVIQVVLNLLSNARKFSGPGSPIDVTVGEESRHLFVEVRDQGPGIRKRDQKRVFRAFYRADRSSGPSGFGLGLAYCKKVAESHRGKMRVNSAPGRGAAFTLEIPLVYAAERGA